MRFSYTFVSVLEYVEESWKKLALHVNYGIKTRSHWIPFHCQSWRKPL